MIHVWKILYSCSILVGRECITCCRMFYGISSMQMRSFSSKMVADMFCTPCLPQISTWKRLVLFDLVKGQSTSFHRFYFLNVNYVISQAHSVQTTLKTPIFMLKNHYIVMFGLYILLKDRVILLLRSKIITFWRLIKYDLFDYDSMMTVRENNRLRSVL